jgi:NAD(P)-dependent dehydrogenase (short-subunit alcohol dehydrogenase family)
MKKIILITGISSGFGKNTARLLSEKGHIVYGTVRKNSDQLPLVNYLTADLTDNVSISEAVSSVVRKEGRIDILINNAGMHTGGSIETSPIENVKLQTDTNLMGTVVLTREVLPIMRKQGGGTIINISSIGGLMGLPFQGFYSASKFALEGFSEALRMEVSPFKINVVVINPGDFNTSNTANRRNYLSPSTDDDPYYKQFTRTLAIIEKDESNGWDPHVMARKIAKIVECKNPRQRYIIASSDQKLAVILKRVMPAKLFRIILQNHYKIK